MDEQRAIQLCVTHRDPVGFEFLVQKYRREAFFHAFALLGNQQDALGPYEASLVGNPIADPERAGRLRDNLAILAEGDVTLDGALLAALRARLETPQA